MAAATARQRQLTNPDIEFEILELLIVVSGFWL
jgi:hypothetical protein